MNIKTRSHLPAGQLSVLGGGAAVVTFKLVFGLFEEGIQAVLQAGPVTPLPRIVPYQVLQAPRQQRLLHVRVPAPVHLLWDLQEGRDGTVFNHVF